MDLSVTLVEPFGSDGCSHCKRVSLTKRTGGILNHSLDLSLWVSGSYRTPLTEILQILQGELTCQTELTVKHRSHVSRIQEETVTRFPSGIVRIVFKELAKEDVDKICAAHSTTRVTTLCFFYCCGSQDTNVIRCTIQKLC